MSTNLKLSILITAYNQDKYIAECIDSICEQNYPDKEIIVVDDGSSDRTPEILKEYANKGLIKLISHTNHGVSYSRNVALAAASGDFVTFVDGDDKIAPDTYSSNMEFFKSDNTLDCIVFPIVFQWNSEKENVTIPNLEKLSNKATIYEYYLTYKISFSVCDKIIRKSAISDLKFREDIRYEDVEANRMIIPWMRNILISPNGRYLYRFHQDSFITSRMSYKKMSDYFNVTFSFLQQAQENNVGHIYLSYYLSRWLRLKFFLIYPLLKESEKEELISVSSKVSICRIQLVLHLLGTKISLKKFRSLWALSRGQVYKAILLSNSKYDKETFLPEYMSEQSQTVS